jgi:two-component system, chemotaxis family, chemotaxis protein CheY
MKTILIADDSQFMRFYLKKLLGESSFKFSEAQNGLQAINMYKTYSPDIVLMDIAMPFLSGIDALKEIIRMDPNAKVVMCSSLGQQPIIIDAIQNGAKDFVIKPHFDYLAEIVNKYTQQSIKEC